MAGTNQHYIPQFLLKAFTIPGSDKRVWRFGRGEQPRMQAIRRTASENSFYSDPEQAGDGSLDASISARESGDLSTRLNEVRSMRPGESPPSDDASSLVLHLSQRTAYVRSTLVESVAGVGRRWQERLQQNGGVEALFGLGGTRPTAAFRKSLMEAISKKPDIAAQWRTLAPKDQERTLQRFHQFLRQSAREQASSMRSFGEALITRSIAETPTTVRGAHTDALTSQLAGV